MATIEERIRFVREGKYFAEVAVDIVVDETGWSPGLTLEGAEKLDRVRVALQAGDVKTAAHYAKVYEAKLIAPPEDRIDEPGRCCTNRHTLRPFLPGGGVWYHNTAKTTCFCKTNPIEPIAKQGRRAGLFLLRGMG